MSEPTGPVGFTLEDFESSKTSTAAPLSSADVKLEASDLPEELKGKTLQDINTMFNGLKSAVAISENARRAAESAAEARQSAAEIAAGRRAPEPVAPQYTREQINELFATDPAQAVALLMDMNNKDLVGHFDKRLSGIAGAGTASAQKAAQADYPLEFELFGDDIKKFVGDLPDKSALATPEGWENIISYVRGKKGNFEKFIAAKADSSTTVNRETARQGQRQDAAPVLNSSTRSSVVVPAGMDETSRAIADEFIKSGVFKDYAEYAKWQKQ